MITRDKSKRQYFTRFIESSLVFVDPYYVYELIPAVSDKIIVVTTLGFIPKTAAAQISIDDIEFNGPVFSRVGPYFFIAARTLLYGSNIIYKSISGFPVWLVCINAQDFIAFVEYYYESGTV